MKNIIFFSLTCIATAYAADEKSEIKSLQRNLQEICNSPRLSPRLSPRIDSPRKLTPSEKKRMHDLSYIMDNTTEPSERDPHKTLELEEQFKHRPLLAFHVATNRFRIIKDQVDLNEGETYYPCSPRLSEDEVRKRYNIED